LARVREVALGAYVHQDLPFEKLVEELRPERSLRHTPLFQVMLNLLNPFDNVLELARLRVEPVWRGDVESKFDLTLYVAPNDEGMRLNLVFNADLFETSRMDELLEQFKHLLEQIVEAPHKPIRSYSLVTARSRQLLPDPTVLLSEPHFAPITSEFLARVKQSPTQKAATQGDRSWTYEELSASARNLAQVLVTHGVKAGDVVAVTGPRSFGLIASILGVFMSGAVLLAIDSNLPANRQRFMIDAARAKHLLYVGDQRHEDGGLREIPGLNVIAVTKDNGLGISNSTLSPPDEVSLPEITSDDAAYIFFTSATTGTPKGILGCHKGLSHFLAWQKSVFEIGPSDRCAQLTNLSFDVVLRDIFLPLISGATLFLPDEVLDPASDQTLLWLDRQGITLFHAVPTLAQMWLGDVHDGVTLRKLRWAFFAGEALTQPFVRRWRAAFPEAGQIVNLYGPTETTLAKCFGVVPDEPPPGVQPIGKPLPQSQALVLNEHGQLCGVREPGEIVLRTAFRTLGYVNAPDEQRKRFVKNPFRDDPRDLVYYTGDRGRYGLDGRLEILGRLDDQVKVRGVRVEPGEVAAILGQHPNVKTCFVAARKDHREDNMLVAYVVSSALDVAAASDLRSYLGIHLPAALVPSAFVFLEALPLTPNGKVDRRALPEPALVTTEPESSFLAPRTPVERSLADIWCQTLNLKRVGVRDNFFDSGGHSLIATQLISRIRREFRVELPLRAIFERPTVENLALYLLEQRARTIGFDAEKMLSELESSSDESAASQLLEMVHKPAGTVSNKQAKTSQSAAAGFYCPSTKSEFFGKRECNLIIVINEYFEMTNFERITALVRDFDPAINAVVVRDSPCMNIGLGQRPTLTFSPAAIRHHPPQPGRVYCGYPLSKSEECTALAKLDIPVPQWVMLTEDETPDLSDFDDYVVRKPNYGGRSAEVRIVRKDRVRWKPIITKAAGTSPSMIVQRFIYTGLRPISYRVSTLFGRVLYCIKQQASRERPPLPTYAHLKSAVTQKGFSISATAQGAPMELSFDEEVIWLGEQAHAAFPNIPLLGFDIVREVPSGKLYVLEANAIGYVWHLHSRQHANYGLSFEEQFDGVRKAAYILAEKTQQCAE
jgi:amino acid adenylation domain-containing protein